MIEKAKAMTYKDFENDNFGGFKNKTFFNPILPIL